MGRHGYIDDYCDDILAHGRWRAQVSSAIRGKRGQQFLRELIAALEAMPNKRLIAKELVKNGEVCALGAVGLRRGIKLDDFDSYDFEGLAEAFGIAHQMVQEIEWENDENSCARTPEERWKWMHDWATGHLTKPKPTGGEG